MNELTDVGSSACAVRRLKGLRRRNLVHRMLNCYPLLFRFDVL